MDQEKEIKEITERETGVPPMVRNREIMRMIGNPVIDAYVKMNVESITDEL